MRKTGTVLIAANKATDINQHWLSGEPNNSGGNEDCLVIKNTGTANVWEDHFCDSIIIKGYICEIVIPAA
jgi:hypothetical protein